MRGEARRPRAARGPQCRSVRLRVPTSLLEPGACRGKGSCGVIEVRAAAFSSDAGPTLFGGARAGGKGLAGGRRGRPPYFACAMTWSALGARG
jgi:hypothetical protein